MTSKDMSMMPITTRYRLLEEEGILICVVDGSRAKSLWLVQLLEGYW